MCGILGIFDVAPNTTQAQLRKKLIDCARRLRHRGPDWSGYQLLSRSPDGARRLMGVGASSSFDTVSKCARRVREEASPPPRPAAYPRAAFGRIVRERATTRRVKFGGIK